MLKPERRYTQADVIFPTFRYVLEPQEQLSLQLHPENPLWLRLHVPYTRMVSYLSLVKNIHGRRWNPDTKVWEVPYTRLTLRFVEQYLRDVTKIAFIPAQDIPETLVLRHSAVLRYTPTKEVTPARYEQAVTALEQCLMLKRYSWRTIKAYKN